MHKKILMTTTLSFDLISLACSSPPRDIVGEYGEFIMKYFIVKGGYVPYSVAVILTDTNLKREDYVVVGKYVCKYSKRLILEVSKKHNAYKKYTLYTNTHIESPDKDYLVHMGTPTVTALKFKITTIRCLSTSEDTLDIVEKSGEFVMRYFLVKGGFVPDSIAVVLKKSKKKKEDYEVIKKYVCKSSKKLILEVSNKYDWRRKYRLYTDIHIKSSSWG